MRLFVAVPLPEGVRLALAASASRIASAVRGLAPVGPEAIHVTLRFLGEVESGAARDLRARMRGARFAAPAFPATLGGYGQFPARGQPRVLFAGFRSGAEGFEAVQREVLALTAGVGEEEREGIFVPHVTLARNKLMAIPRGAPALAELIGELDGMSAAVEVRSAVLYESVLGKGGPRYTALEEVRCAP